MTMTYLKFNDEKTKCLIFGSKHQLAMVTPKGIQIAEHVIQPSLRPSPSAYNIGTVFDVNMKMELHVNSVCKAAWYQCSNINKIMKNCSADQTKTLI